MEVAMPNGYNGKILHVDLTEGTLTVEEPNEAFYRKYMGGSAMGIYYILRDMPKGANPLGPENVLTLMASVTTGAAISGQSRINANAKSPISGGIGDSQGGGFFPAELKFAGFDGLVIKGKSEKPVYLWIKDGEFELRDAAHLMDKKTGEVDEILKEELGDKKIEILQHGPAAEKGVIFSSLVSMANRNNGRTGMGLVMASKNLKAVVVRGRKKPAIANPAALAALNKTGPKILPDNPDMPGLAAEGTATVVLFQNTIGSLPAHNYNEGQFDGCEDIGGARMVDTIAAGASIAFAMECYEKGIITKEQTGGIELKFGDADAMLAALEAIVKCEGPLGEVLSQGSERAAKSWGNGADEYLITVKGAEAPAHMPQAKRSLSLIYAVNPFGADHQSSEHDPYYEEGVADLNLNRLMMIGLDSPQALYSLNPEKVRFAYLTEVFYSMLDSVELCQFVFGPAWTLYGPAETVEMVRAVTGWDVTIQELMAIGERRLNLFRIFNAREGLDRKADKLPKKFFKQLQGVGPTAGIALTHEEVESAIDEYYKLAGWTNNGIPTPETMERLDIAWAL